MTQGTEELAAVKIMLALHEAYDRQYPGITAGKVLEMENAALEEQARNSGVVMPEWRSEVIDLRLVDGSTTKMKAEILGQLAVHVALFHRWRARPKYSLIHLETTYIISSDLTLKHAKYLAERFVYFDWTLIDGQPASITRESCWVIIQAAHLLGLWKQAPAKRRLR